MGGGIEPLHFRQEKAQELPFALFVAMSLAGGPAVLIGGITV
jgi:hypothetical protein